MGTQLQDIRRALIIFMKAPEAGRCKTRLCPPLSSTQAAALYRAFCEDTLATARSLAVPTMIAYEPGPGFPTPEWAQPGAPFFVQEGPDLGARITHAFATAFGRRHEHVVVIGSDAPALPARRLREAFAALESRDAVFGPAADGGYYLVGLRKPVRSLFDRIPWSTPGVMEATRAAAAAEGVEMALLAEEPDVDTSEDLLHLAELLRRAPDSLAPATRRALGDSGMRAALAPRPA